MNLLARVRTLLKTPPSFLLGRFYLFRSAFSCWMRFRQRVGGSSLPPMEGLAFSEIMRTSQARAAVAAMRESALFEGISLPPAMVAEITEFAKQSELSVTGVKHHFRYTEITKGRLKDGTFVALGHCEKPTQCPAVCKIRDDSVLQSIVANYLGYIPRTGDIRLYWSFVGDATDQERRNMYQTIDYHYDVHDYNFCYVHIYLTNTDVNSGAHVMVLGSHKSKPLRWLLGSVRQSDEAIKKYYGEKKVVCLERSAGEGFIEDTSCFHKALAPISRERLMLQIRYH